LRFLLSALNHAISAFCFLLSTFEFVLSTFCFLLFTPVLRPPISALSFPNFSFRFVLRPRSLALSALLFAFISLPLAHATDFYVATNGNDSNPGTIGQPFATLTAARNAIRALSHPLSSPTTVWIRGGRYYLQSPLELSGSEDSGTGSAGVTYSSYPHETPYVIGGISVTGFQSVTAPAILSRLTASAKTNVLVANLASQGITNLGTIVQHGYGHTGYDMREQPWQAELLFQDRAMQLARYPNSNWLAIASYSTTSAYFSYSDNEPSNWVAVADAVVQGYWYYDYADSWELVQSIDTSNKIVYVTPPGPYSRYRATARFYFLNILEELDSPGEYYVDRTNGFLYFWPPSAISNEACILSTVTNLVTLTSVSNVSFSGLTLEASRRLLFAIIEGQSNLVTHCVLRGASANGVYVTNSTGTAVSWCSLYDLGERGIQFVKSGTRSTLTSGNNSATYNTISNVCRLCQCKSAIEFSHKYPSQDVVGVYVAHNLIHDLPHQAIIFYGNNHIIEFNELHHVCTETADSAAIYVGGDWTFRGNIIRYNYFHDINIGGGAKDYDGVKGVYIDNGVSGTTVYGNVFCDVDHGVYINGGRDNIVQNNIFVDCTNTVSGIMPVFGVTVDQYLLSNPSLAITLSNYLAYVPYQNALWSSSYPALATITNGNAMLATNNWITTNISYNNTSWIYWQYGANTNSTVMNNLTTGDPPFVNYAGRNFGLLTNSPVWPLGFQAIPTGGFGPALVPASGLHTVNGPP
jgi:hypothetical protein